MKKYTKEHEWIEMVDETTAIVGITEFAQSELGEIVFIDVPTLDEHLESMELFGSIEAVKTVADLHIPVSGTVVELNGEIEDHPEIINEDAEGNGWIVKVEIDNINDLDELMTDEQYSIFIKQ